MNSSGGMVAAVLEKRVELGVLLEVGDDIRTARNDRQAAVLREIESRFGEESGHAVVLAGGRHLGVVEVKPAGSVVVILEKGDAFGKADFEAMRRCIVLDRDFRCVSVGLFHRARVAQELTPAGRRSSPGSRQTLDIT